MTVDSAPGDGGTAPGALSGRLKRGALISAGSLVFVQGLSLVQTLIVARLLSPAEVGLFAAGTVLTNFLVNFSEGGLRSALIQREGDEEDAAETVFWATLAMGVLMSLAALGAAPILAQVFDSPVVGLIAAATSGTLVLHALTNVPDGLLQRRFDFRQRSIIDPAVGITFAACSVALAWTGHGVWSLVIATYASMTTWVVTVWILARWRPGRGRASVRLWRQLARFAFPLVIVEINERVREIAETVIVGRGLSDAALGNYKYGRRIAMLPGVAIMQICSYVLFPAFSRISGDSERFGQAFRRALRWIWFAAVPMGALLIAIGEPLVVVLLGDPWRGGGVVLVAMSGYGMGMALDSVASEAIKGHGRTTLLNWMTGVRLVSTIGLLIALVPLGLVGVGLSVSISYLLVGLVGLGLAAPLVALSWSEIVRLLYGPVIAAAAGVAAVAPLEHLAAHSDSRPLGVAIGLLAAESLLFVAVYLVVHRIVAPSTVRELVRVITTKLRRKGPVEDDVTMSDGR